MQKQLQERSSSLLPNRLISLSFFNTEISKLPLGGEMKCWVRLVQELWSFPDNSGRWSYHSLLFQSLELTTVYGRNTDL